MMPRFPPGNLVALSVASMTGAALMALLAWAHMSAFHAAYGVVCGSQVGLLAHCPACHSAVALLLLALSFLALAASARQRPLLART